MEEGLNFTNAQVKSLQSTTVDRDHGQIRVQDNLPGKPVNISRIQKQEIQSVNLWYGGSAR